jgi:hypothetical protein
MGDISSHGYLYPESSKRRAFNSTENFILIKRKYLNEIVQ